MYDKDNPKHQKKLLTCVKSNKDKNRFDYWNKVMEEMNKEFNEQTNDETWRSRFRSLGDEYLVQKQKLTHSYDHNKDKQERLIAYLKQERTIPFLQEMLDMTEIELLGYIQKMKLEGYEIIVLGDKVSMPNKQVVTNHTFRIQEGDTSTIKIGVVSDPHLCSKYQQLTLLNMAYDSFAEQGITTVLNCGDITDGQSNRPEHKYELFCLGADDQAQYVIDNYPQREGITTYFICGNHDTQHFKNGGIDIGKAIGNARSDMIYLGTQQATVIINNCKIRMFHPLDGSSYAYSYSGQKTIDAIRGGSKPNIMLVGHHHKQMYFVYRNIHYFEVPSFQAETPFIQGKRLSNDVGYWTIEAEIDELGNVIRMRPELTPFYITKEFDYTIPENKNYTKELVIE